MLGLIISLLPALIVLGVLIFVHELGHFLVARWNGVKVEKFSIGFGPEVFGWTSRATRYAISLIPLGGFVKLAGESFDTLEGRKVQADDFISKNIFQRFLVVFAGPLMNLITGFLILVAVFCVGRPLPANVIGDFVKGYPAETSGLQKGDRILKINEKETPSWIQVTEAIVFNESENLQVLVDRNGEKLIFSVGTKEESGKELTGDHKKIRRLGIKPDMHERLIEKYGLLESIKQAFFSCSDMIRMMFYTFWKLVTFQLSVKSLSGPVQIFAVAGETAKFGLIPLLDLAAFLSISLAVFNVLPIPALDGGHLFFMLLETIRRKPISSRVQEKATVIGFVSLILLMVVVTFNDISKTGFFEKVRAIITRS